MEKGKEYDMLHVRVRGPKILPEESERHVRSAGREMLLAARSIFDELIERLEEKPKQVEERSGQELSRVDM